MTGSSAFQAITDNLFLYRDTCNVYVIRSGTEGVLIDFGSGAVLDNLAGMGINHITDVLLTHHHRDQAQGLARAVENDIRIWVPHVEQDLFHAVDSHWQSREISMNYLMRQDRFSLLESVPITGTLDDYEIRSFGSHSFMIVPTPGHTIGSITIIADVDGIQAAFTGDLIFAPGKVWSLAATQWSYNGAEGAASSILSLLDLKTRQPDILLPSHGDPMNVPEAAIDLLIDRLWQLLQLRQQNLRLFELLDQPYEAITPHLLRHRAIIANSYVILAQNGKALMIDFGYDFGASSPAGSDRASRRPWLYSIPKLRQQFGIEKIDVVMPTHFHDDHVAGIHLLSRVEGTQVWATETFADILENPSHYDLPCLWYDPIPVHRRLPLQTPIQWEEYTFTLYPLPGHTRYAVAIFFEIDGKRVLATGDQYQGSAGLELNYVYANRFSREDYLTSSALYQAIQPDLIITGHWDPLWVTPAYLEKLPSIGAELQRLHDMLLPTSPDMGDEGFLARLSPYQPTVTQGMIIDFEAEIRNPLAHSAEAVAEIVLPPGWQMADKSPWKIPLQLNASGIGYFQFAVTPPAGLVVRRARIALDLTLDGQRFGQQAEALVTITP